MGKKRIRFGSRDKKTEDFVDPDKDPYSYLKRYILEENYKDWFERNYPDNTIYDAVGLNEWDYNEMKKKLSTNQDTVEDTSKLEPESKPEPEPEPESESKPEPEWTGKAKTISNNNVSRREVVVMANRFSVFGGDEDVAENEPVLSDE